MPFARSGFIQWLTSWLTSISKGTFLLVRAEDVVAEVVDAGGHEPFAVRAPKVLRHVAHAEVGQRVRLQFIRVRSLVAAHTALALVLHYCGGLRGHL